MLQQDRCSVTPARHRKADTARPHLHVGSETVQLVKTESRVVAARWSEGAKVQLFGMGKPWGSNNAQHGE